MGSTNQRAPIRYLLDTGSGFFCTPEPGLSGINWNRPAWISPGSVRLTLRRRDGMGSPRAFDYRTSVHRRRLRSRIPRVASVVHEDAGSSRVSHEGLGCRPLEPKDLALPEQVEIPVLECHPEALTRTFLVKGWRSVNRHLPLAKPIGRDRINFEVLVSPTRVDCEKSVVTDRSWPEAGWNGPETTRGADPSPRPVECR